MSASSNASTQFPVAPHPQPTPSLGAPRRVLGLADASCVVIGAIIGVGIFFNPSRIASLTGDPTLALTSWLIGGFIALCGALVFAELGGRYHNSGAQYDILRDCFGPLPAFLFVFCNATGTQACAIGIISLICAQHLVAAIGLTPVTGWRLVTIAACLISLLALANIAGVKWGSRIQNFTVACKVFTLLAITAVAALLAKAPPDSAPVAATLESTRPLAGVVAGLVPALFAYGGWQQALWISGEVKHPHRNVPRAIILGVLVVVAAYMLVNWGYLRLLGIQGVADSKVLAADAVATVYPRFGARVVALAVAISAFGVLNSQLLSGPRLIFGMARDGRFFATFARLSPRFGTPAGAILLLAVPAILLIAVAGQGGIDYLLNGAVFIDCVFFILTGASIFVLRRRHAGDTPPPGSERRFRMPLFPLVPILFILGQLGAVVGSVLDPAVRSASYIGALWILVGVIVFAWRFRLAAVPHAA
ncbi:MAG: APC family permease [Phycisphaerales bacterium]